MTDDSATKRQSGVDPCLLAAVARSALQLGSELRFASVQPLRLLFDASCCSGTCTVAITMHKLAHQQSGPPQGLAYQAVTVGAYDELKYMK